MRVFLKSNVCRKIFLPFLFVLLSTSFVLAQSATISGVVTDNTTGHGLAGATVVVQGTKNGTATKEDGSFSITVPNGNSVLRFSFLGYITKDIPVKSSNTSLNVQLLPNQKSLNEVVVVGYGSQNKKDVTGSVAQLDASKFEERPLSNVAQAMQGQMAGVQVRTTTGEPGAALQIKVRGTASVNSGSDPLYVVDGVPIDNLVDINPTDIASIVVLKDAASTAIYGSRATNGVVL
ncbi:MAG TPA: carboxypeptidase-like regulatory domain-containing protein, partial [Hanamia sp.]|nr:carboxypeptidase-like regulatory domain-containing protein [Hanamia sp.]